MELEGSREGASADCHSFFFLCGGRLEGGWGKEVAARTHGGSRHRGRERLDQRVGEGMRGGLGTLMKELRVPAEW